MAEEADPWEKMEITFHHFSWLNREVLRLGDEARQYKSLAANFQLENARLQAQVERLKAETERLLYLFNESNLKNDRLRKAGDGLASSIQFNEEMAKDYNGPTVVHQCVKAWNAAKEGRPNE